MEKLEITIPTAKIPLSELVARVSQRLAGSCNLIRDGIRLKKYQYQGTNGILHLEYEILKDAEESIDGDNLDQSEKQDDTPPELAYRKRYSQY